MRLHPEIFRAYDIRGVAETMLTEEIAYLIGRALGFEMRARKLTVTALGRDGRLSSPGISQSLCRGLLDSGISVIDIGIVASPVLYFAAHRFTEGSGIMITGSHNPPEYNGVKMLLGGKVLAGNAIAQLRNHIEAKAFAFGMGSLQYMDVKEAYWQAITQDIRLSRTLHVIVDAGNGAAGPFAPTLYRRLGCEVQELFCDVDGHFPHHHPDPAVLSNLNTLAHTLSHSDADIGLAFDGDADRLGVVTKKGKVIFADRIMMLLAADILSRHKGATIAYDVKSTRLLDKWIRTHGGKPLLTPTGHSNLKAAINDKGALLAGEFSGHFCIKDRWFGFDDGMYAGARLLECLSCVEDVDACLEALPDCITTPELYIPLQEGEPRQVIEALFQQHDFPDAKVITLDGLRVEYEDGFGLARTSNTMPSITLRFEADTEAALARIQDDFRANLAPLIQQQLPF